jgi:hypothetical protein
LTLEWDAAEYEAVSAPQTGWGADFLGVFLERNGLRGDETGDGAPSAAPAPRDRARGGRL